MSLDIASMSNNVYQAHTFLSSVSLGRGSEISNHYQGLPPDCKYLVDSYGRGQLVYTAISQRRFDLPVAFEVFKSSLKIVRYPVAMSRQGQGVHTRGSVRQLTHKSKTRLRFTCLNSRLPLISQFCMTYPADFPKDGRLVQAHFNKFMTAFRDYHNRRNIDFVYLWVKEFQGRGAPHYHLYLSLPVSKTLHSYMAHLWNRIAADYQEDHLSVHLNPRQFCKWDMGTGHYLTKYLEKSYQKMTPDDFKDVGRFWGASRGIVKIEHDIPTESLKELLSESDIKRIVRWLGKWHENKLKTIYRSMKDQGKKAKKLKSNIRRTIQSTHTFFGAPIFRKIVNYLFNQPDPLPDPVPF